MNEKDITNEMLRMGTLHNLGFIGPEEYDQEIEELKLLLEEIREAA